VSGVIAAMECLTCGGSYSFGARVSWVSLDEIRALLRLSEADGGTTCADVRELAARHLSEVKRKLADLRTMERALSDALRRCDTGEIPGCPLIDALSAD